MATSGSLTTSKYDGRYYKLAWERTSYSTANNTSTIKWTLSAHGGNSSWYAERTLTVVIAGTTVKSKTASVNRYTGEIDSGTLTIKHDSDGSKSFTASVKAAVYYSSVNCTGSKTFTLNTIPRESTISATNAYVENESTITVNRKVSSYTHTITWACGSASGTVATKSSSTSIKWKLPTSIYAQIGSTAKSKTVTLTCKTYNSSGTQIGDSKTCTLTANTSASRNGPTLSPTITTYAKTQELTGNSTTLIAGVSEAAIVFNAAAQDSATLSSKKVTNSGKSRTTDGDFSNCTSGEFVFTATDSRGYTKTVTKTLKVVNYIKPTITLKVNIGVDGTATIKANGKFFNGSFGKVTNALNIQFKYKEEGGTYSAWTNFATAAPGANSWSASHTLTGLDYSKTYVFQAHATDLAEYGAVTEEKRVRAYPVYDWGENDFHFHVPVFTTAPLQVQAISCGSATTFAMSKGTTKIPLNLYAKNGDLLEVYDGGVRCLADGVVLVAGAVHVTGLTAGNTVQVEIVKNTSAYAASFGQSGTRTFLTTQLTPRLVNVNAGDVIYLYGGNYQEASGNISTNNNTILTVIYLGGR